MHKLNAGGGCEKKEILRKVRNRVVDIGTAVDFVFLDPTIIHCPVAACQAPVMKPTDVDQESGWGRLRQCSQCFFSFCAFCRRTWYVWWAYFY